MTDASSKQRVGGLFRGPPAYVSATPWPWHRALGAALLILALSNAAAAVLFAKMPTARGMLWLLGAGFWGEQRAVLLAMEVAVEVLIVVLTLAACRLLGGTIPGVALGAPAGGRTTYLGGVLMGLGLWGLLGLLAFLPTELVTLLVNLQVMLEEIVGVRAPPPSPLPSPTDTTQWVLLGVGVMVTGPLAEELLFRGFLLSALSRSRLGFGGAAVLTSVLFAAWHGDAFIPRLLELFIMGLAFSWLLWRTGSLRVPVVSHAAFNGAWFVSESTGLL